MAEANSNLWAPWRGEYVRGLSGENARCCFLCDYWSAPAHDAGNGVVLRGAHGLVVMNRYPYTSGHLMVCCGGHKAGYEDLNEAELLELNVLTRDAIRMLMEILAPHGFNVGANIGRSAGAGLVGHLHVHVVPRWDGDTNYMSVVADTRVIPQSLDSLYAELTTCAVRLDLCQ